MAQLRAEEEHSQQHAIHLDTPVGPSAEPANTEPGNEPQVGGDALHESPPDDSALSTDSGPLRHSNAEDTIDDLDNILSEPDRPIEGCNNSLLRDLMFRQTRFS